jgi:hypothetical protein
VHARLACRLKGDTNECLHCIGHQLSPDLLLHEWPRGAGKAWRVPGVIEGEREEAQALHDAAQLLSLRHSGYFGVQETRHLNGAKPSQSGAATPHVCQVLHPFKSQEVRCNDRMWGSVPA